MKRKSSIRLTPDRSVQMCRHLLSRTCWPGQPLEPMASTWPDFRIRAGLRAPSCRSLSRWVVRWRWWDSPAGLCCRPSHKTCLSSSNTSTRTLVTLSNIWGLDQRFVTQLCLQIWLGGTPVLLASPKWHHFGPASLPPRNVMFCLHSGTNLSL